jgi:hypothetical protein
MPHLLVVGDSIQWGQGLDEPEKMSALLREAWQAAAGVDVTVHRFAHSGADVWDDGQSGILAAINPVPPPFPGSFPITHAAIAGAAASAATEAERDAIGEIPSDAPFLLRQILDAKISLAGTEVDLVLVDGGINDTEIYNLVLPGKDLAAVVARAQSLLPRICFALTKVGEAFPKAKILLTGYYPVVSRQSRLLGVLQFAKRVAEAAVQEGVQDLAKLVPLLEHPFEPALQKQDVSFAELSPQDPLGALAGDLANRCAAWTMAMHSVLRQAAAIQDSTGRLAAFVDPQFGPETAIFAPTSLLWRFKDGQPTDPLAGARKRFCDANGIEGFRRLLVECASLGHPAPAGAKKYAAAVIAQARSLGVF